MNEQGPLPDAPPRLALAYNPAAGSFSERRLDALARALENRGFDVTLLPTRTEGFLMPERVDLVCVHGGDGTVRVVARALGERIKDVALCIAPAGTVNLLARELGYHANPVRFAAQVRAAWDRGETSWRRSPMVTGRSDPLLACFSIGPDSAAVAAVSASLKARVGRLAYLVAALGQLRRWPRACFAVNAVLEDGASIQTRAEAAFVARGMYYAGPFRLSRGARLETDSFRLVLLERAGRRHSLAFAALVMMGISPARLGLARQYCVREVHIERCAVPPQVDGDALEVGPVDIRLAGPCVRYCV